MYITGLLSKRFNFDRKDLNDNFTFVRRRYLPNERRVIANGNSVIAIRLTESWGGGGGQSNRTKVYKLS